VYGATRKHVEAIAAALSDHGIRALHYHAGMNPREGAWVQEAFLTDGEEVIVTTNAFGMGVDKANVRFVFHYDISPTVDAYYQESGCRRSAHNVLIGPPGRASLYWPGGSPPSCRR
jgi:ATP-dependent DNA helicase RecQ